MDCGKAKCNPISASYQSVGYTSGMPSALKQQPIREKVHSQCRSRRQDWVYLALSAHKHRHTLTHPSPETVYFISSDTIFYLSLRI